MHKATFFVMKNISKLTHTSIICTAFLVQRPCPPNSRCVDGHCTGEALTVGKAWKPLDTVQHLEGLVTGA